MILERCDTNDDEGGRRPLRCSDGPNARNNPTIANFLFAEQLISLRRTRAFDGSCRYHDLAEPIRCIHAIPEAMAVAISG